MNEILTTQLLPSLMNQTLADRKEGLAITFFPTDRDNEIAGFQIITM